MAKPHKTTEQAGIQITRGENSWEDRLDTPVTLTWAFRSSVPSGYVSSEDSDEGATFARMNAAERAAARDALDRYSDVANIHFRQVSDTGSPDGFSNSATLLFGTYANPDDGAAAFAWMPGETVGPFSGDRSFDAVDGDFWYNRALSGPSPQQGDYDYLTFLHEIGHTVGLDHPGDYDAAPGLDITYARDAVYREDTIQYTVMSYFDASDSHDGAKHFYTDSSGRSVDVYASTLLKDDIAAVQRLYGANTHTRHGATTYGFHSNAGGDGYGIAGGKQVVFCIYDTGGTDTLDLSGYRTNQVIDLHAESFSNAGLLRKNVSIAEGTIVENALGGSGNDRMLGNDAANRLDGGGGRDVMLGGNGSDTYVVDNAADRVIESAGSASGSRDTVRAAVSETLSANVENLLLTGTRGLSATGNSLDNALTGNAGANLIAGGHGADRLTGGAGADTFLFRATGDSTASSSGRDTITDFHPSQHDRIDLHLLSGPALHFIGDADFHHAAGELRAQAYGPNTLVSADIDGNGAADFAIVLRGHVVLDAGDFVL